MKLIAVFVGLLASATAQPESITAYNYHEAVGITEATRIQQAEAALDFDGSRIVGGSISRLGANPHLGGMVVTLLDRRTSVCGSCLLTNTKAVTAAHCWTDGRAQAVLFTLVHGSLRLFSGGVRTSTSNVVMHPNWNPSNGYSDIAVVTFFRVNFNNNIQPITLASGNNNYVGTWALASGYGAIAQGESVSRATVQREVSLRVISNAECRQTFSFISDSVLCVDTQGGRASTCGGDSGGPLDIGNGNSRALIGITSFGHNDGCQRGHPAAFTRVTSFNAWIRSHL
ncbi:unnamed protein product [Leptosia nina]|uniref:Peptidase S1 domain-containing protein n=1 Tax=Leptosia nina TaxID=320188 RepID=A0AAV1JKU0_9NEOP